MLVGIPLDELKQKMNVYRMQNGSLELVYLDIPCLLGNVRTSPQWTDYQGETSIESPVLFCNFYNGNEKLDIQLNDIIEIENKRFLAREPRNPGSQNDHWEIVLERQSFTGDNL